MANGLGPPNSIPRGMFEQVVQHVTLRCHDGGSDSHAFLLIPVVSDG